jgi:hypothetical protein
MSSKTGLGVVSQIGSLPFPALAEADGRHVQNLNPGGLLVQTRLASLRRSKFRILLTDLGNDLRRVLQRAIQSIGDCGSAIQLRLDRVSTLSTAAHGTPGSS